MTKSKFAAFTLLILTLITGLPGSGFCWQQSEQSDETDAARILRQIRTEIEANNWKGVADGMTADAWDAFCAQLVVECISVANIDEYLPIPGINHAQDDIRAALKKHGLDKLEIKYPSIEIKTGEGHGSDKLDKDKVDTRAGKDSQRQEIVKHLKETDDRMTIVADLWKAKSSSPLAANVFMGKIEEQIVDGDTILVKIAPARPDVPEDGGGSIVIAIPPVFVNFCKLGEEWKFAGTNFEKTEQAMKDFRPHTHGGSDF